jgi:hypothetical protein
MYENSDMKVYTAKNTKDGCFDVVTVVAIIYKGGKQ